MQLQYFSWIFFLREKKKNVFKFRKKVCKIQTTIFAFFHESFRSLETFQNFKTFFFFSIALQYAFRIVMFDTCKISKWCKIYYKLTLQKNNEISLLFSLDRGLKGTVVNQACHYIDRGSIAVTSTILLKKISKKKIRNVKNWSRFRSVQIKE